MDFVVPKADPFVIPQVGSPVSGRLPCMGTEFRPFYNVSHMTTKNNEANVHVHVNEIWVQHV
jgi:hypothetical protein